MFVFTFDTETPGAQVHARMFAPAFGIVEDPATGGGITAVRVGGRSVLMSEGWINVD